MFYIFKMAKPESINCEGQILIMVKASENLEYVDRGHIGEEIVDNTVLRRYNTTLSSIYYYPLTPIVHQGVEVSGYAEESKGKNYFFNTPTKRDKVSIPIHYRYSGPMDMNFFVLYKSGRHEEGTMLEEWTPEGRLTKTWIGEGFHKWRCTLGATKIDQVIRLFQGTGFEWRATFDRRWYKSCEMKKLIKLFLDGGVSPEQVRKVLNIKPKVSDEMVAEGKEVPFDNGTYLELYEIIVKIDSLIKNHA